MKANELRLGNLIAFTSSDFGSGRSGDGIVSAIQETLIVTTNGVALYPIELQPIPLTEEWLKEKFDCKITSEGIWNRIECNYKDAEKSILPLFTLYHSITKKEFMYVVAAERINKPFSSVHKLQNIHFEIKGEELIL